MLRQTKTKRSRLSMDNHPFKENQRPVTANTTPVKRKKRSPLSTRSVRKVKTDSRKNFQECIYKDHLVKTVAGVKYAKTFEPIVPTEVESRYVQLPNRFDLIGRKTLIFDLDETLIYSPDNLFTAQVVLNAKTPTGEVMKLGINIRPYAIECLQTASELFEVVVFTASEWYYADAILDFLDPDGSLIHHRLYRDSCIKHHHSFVKDLRIFQNRELQNIVIIDNNVISFANQIDNGIPIISWRYDAADKELYNLQDYLKVLSRVKDVRDLNRAVFKLNAISN